MRQTVVGVFNDPAAAVIAAQALAAGGFEQDCVHVDQDDDTGAPGAAIVVIDIEEDVDVDAARDALKSVGAKDIEQRPASDESARTAATGAGAQRPYEDYDSDFRQHFATGNADATGRYEDAEPGYRYGHSLAGDARYAGRNWDEIEPQARRDWEQRNPGSTWERIKASVRHAWERLKS
jgi:hypothetical protein